MKFIKTLSIIVFSLIMASAIALLLFPPTGFAPTDFSMPVALLLFVSAAGFSYGIVDTRAKKTQKTVSTNVRLLKAAGLAFLFTVGALVIIALIMLLLGYLHSQGLLGDGASYWP